MLRSAPCRPAGHAACNEEAKNSKGTCKITFAHVSRMRDVEITKHARQASIRRMVGWSNCKTACNLSVPCGPCAPAVQDVASIFGGGVWYNVLEEGSLTDSDGDMDAVSVFGECTVALPAPYARAHIPCASLMLVVVLGDSSATRHTTHTPGPVRHGFVRGEPEVIARTPMKPEHEAGWRSLLGDWLTRRLFVDVTIRQLTEYMESVHTKV
jgi:hypothetical protein